MAEQTFDLVIIQTMAILNRYGFDLKGYTPMELLLKWGEKYSSIWIRLAVIEALYQGRYKSISVEQILSNWLRKGKPGVHFNYEFERLVCSDLPYSNDPSLLAQSKLYNVNDVTSDALSPENKVNPNVSKPSEPKPITQFIPLEDHSQSYAKLREVIHKGLEDNTHPPPKKD